MAYPDPFYQSDIVGTFAPGMPHLTYQQLQAKTELYLLETDELLDYHLPATPDMKLIGGTETRPAEPLSGELNSFLDMATQGIVIVSLGSIVNHIPGNILNSFSEVFKRESNMKFVFRSGKKQKLSAMQCLCLGFHKTICSDIKIQRYSSLIVETKGSLRHYTMVCR